MKILLRAVFIGILTSWLGLLPISTCLGQKVHVEPENFQLDDSLKIVVDLKECRVQTLLGQDSVFFYSLSPYSSPENGPWDQSPSKLAMTAEGEDRWSIELVPTDFFAADSGTLSDVGVRFLLKAKDGLSDLPQEQLLATEDLYLIRTPYNYLFPLEGSEDLENQYQTRWLGESNQILLDPEGQSDISEARAAYQSGKFIYEDLFTDWEKLRKPFWHHIALQNPLEEARTYHLMLGSPIKSWNQAQVFVVDSSGVRDSLATGFDIATQNKPLEDWRNLVPIQLGPKESVDLFLYASDFASHDLLPDSRFSFWHQINLDHLNSQENRYKHTFYFMLSVLAFVILFYLMWFFMTQKKEQAYYAMLWTGFLLGLLIPSPWGYYAAFNDFALLIKNFFDLSVAWTLMSTLSLWGILGFSIHYLNIPSYFPRLRMVARVLALTPLAIFGLAGLNYLFPHWFSYNPYGLMGYIYRPSTIVRSTLLGVGFVFAFVMGILVHQKGFRPAKYYLIAFLPLTVAACLVAMSNIQISIQEAAIGLEDTLNTTQNISICLALILFALAMGYKQKRLETDYREAQDKLVQAQMKSIEEQKKVNDRLRQMDSLKDQFLANTSHELRTPLNGIIGLSEALEGEESDPGKRENLSMIISSGKRLSSLVNDILDFSKLKNHEIELRYKPLDIHAVVDVVLRIHQPLIEGKDLKLINEIPIDTPLIMADEDRLQQILFNLVGNAAKFTERGFVKVSAASLSSMVEIAVTDTGIGIPENKREAIFQAFAQGDGSIQREFAGTGLGLSISKQLVELHGGQMWVDSVIGEGSTFFATFPKASSMASPISKPHSDKTTSEPSETSSQPHPVQAESAPVSNTPLPTALRILVVDDEPINQQVIKNHLKGPDYRLTQAMDGEEALELIEGGQKFDLVLLDVMMPRMSGYEVCQRIRERYLPSELPVIMVTAKNQIADLVQGLDIGANDYLTKPFSKDEFLARIKTHLNLHRINTVTSRFVPTEFIRSLGKSNLTELKLGDLAEKVVTVFFSDIRNYTGLSETMTPAENFRFVNSYAGRMGPIIQSHQGFVNQYLGDGIMAIFQHAADDALLASIAMQHRMVNYNAERVAQGRRPIRVGMGLHTGQLVMGIIGDERRTDAATISDTVNTASRMETLTKTLGAQILLSEQSVSSLQRPEDYRLRYLGKVKVKGKKAPVGVYECFDGDSPEQAELKQSLEVQFKEAIAHYLDQDFDLAISIWQDMLNANPADRVVQYFCQQAGFHQAHGVPEGWVG